MKRWFALALFFVISLAHAQAFFFPAFTVTSQTGPTIALNVSQTSCTAPCPVTFEATGTTSSTTTTPFHSLWYQYIFGDPNTTVIGAACSNSVAAGEGYWRCGDNAGNNSKNVATAPVAGHVYECNSGSTCTFTPSLTVYDKNGNFSTAGATITVTDPNVTYATTATYCYSTSGTFTGCPTGANHITVTGDFCTDATNGYNAKRATGTRHLLRATESFTTSGVCSIDKNGPILIGSYGSGAKPVLNETGNPSSGIFTFSSYNGGTNQTSGIVIQDLAITTNGTVAIFAISGSMYRNVVIQRNDFSGGFGKVMQSSADTAPAGSTAPRYVVFQDNTLGPLLNGGTCTANGANQFFLEAQNVYLYGNYVNNGSFGEHGFRMHWAKYDGIANNSFFGVCGRVPVTIRGYQETATYLTYTGLSSGQVYNEYIALTDNYVEPPAGGGGEFSFCSEDPSHLEKGRNIIVERNFFDGTLHSSSLTLCWPNITIRNNLHYKKNGTVWTVEKQRADMPEPTNLWIYNNSIYNTFSGSTNPQIFLVTNDGTTPTGNAWIQNNILYGPSITHTPMDWVWDNGAASSTSTMTVVVDHNSPAYNTATTWALSDPGTTLSNWRPTCTGTTFPCGQGTNGGTVWDNIKDFNGNSINQSSVDVGAMQH